MHVIYIAGCTHGGTTLLHRILGAHPGVVSLGSVKNLPSALVENRPCSCGAPLRECPAWQHAEAALTLETGSGLASLEVDSSDPVTFAEHNRRLFRAVSEATGAQAIVDCSRNPLRLSRLLSVLEGCLSVVHLYRQPEAQVYAWRKRGHAVRGCLQRYNRIHRAHLGLAPPLVTIRISYEAFCTEPEAALVVILQKAGLEFDPTLLARWGEAPTHVLGGNPMLASKGSEIRLDQDWKHRQSVLVTGLARLACGRTYSVLEESADLPRRLVRRTAVDQGPADPGCHRLYWRHRQNDGRQCGDY
jgi:hypothetical protein